MPSNVIHQALPLPSEAPDFLSPTAAIAEGRQEFARAGRSPHVPPSSGARASWMALAARRQRGSINIPPEAMEV